jgi:hypothetical protein
VVLEPPELRTAVIAILRAARDADAATPAAGLAR